MGFPTIGFKIAEKGSEDGVYIDVKQGGTLSKYAELFGHCTK